MSNLTFDDSNVKLNLDAVDWEDAVREGCQLLIDKGLITPEYPEAIIENVNDSGPYIVLAEDFAMPHARPERGVKELGYSLLTFKEPIDFLGKKARIVLTLAAPDASSHIDLLQKIVQLVNENKLPDIIKSNTIEEIQEIID